MSPRIRRLFLLLGIAFLCFICYNRKVEEVTSHPILLPTASRHALELHDTLRIELLELEAEITTLRKQVARPIGKLQPMSPESDVQVTATTLLGIFSHLGSNETMELRRRSRILLRLHPLACTLQEYQVRKSQCRLVYTFVEGGKLYGQTMRLKEPFTLDDVERRMICEKFPNEADCMDSDMTFLNVKENTHSGKSQTWLAFAAYFAEKHGLEYVAKMTSDTMLRVDEFFDFVRFDLPPAPFNKNMMIGSIIDKNPFRRTFKFFDKSLNKWVDKKNVTTEYETTWRVREKPRKKKYNGPMYFYPEGHFYLLSLDLCKAVVSEASAGPAYLDGVEDQDIGILAMMGAEELIKVVAIAKRERFWIPGAEVWSMLNDAAWELEVARLKRIGDVG